MKVRDTSTLKYLKFNKVLDCAKSLHKISKYKNPKKRNRLILDAEKCVIDAISEIAKNCLAGNINLKTCDFKKLSKYKKTLRQISKKSSVEKRKRILQQKGGFLSLLIPPALSLIASVVGDFISSKLRK
jgi:hypothetical protein